MKKTNRLLALGTVGIMLVGSISTAFAADTTETSQIFVLPGRANYSTQQKEEAAPVVEVKKSTYPDLVYKAKGFTTETGKYLGDSVTIPSMPDLSYKIYLDLLKIYNEYANYEVSSGSTQFDEYRNNYFKVSNTVENFDRYAKITINVIPDASYAYFYSKEYNNSYFVDKETNTAVTFDVFAKATAVEETDTTDEDTTDADATTETVTMIPLRKFAEKLGYTVAWDDEEGFVIIQKGEFATFVIPDVNVYLLADETEIELESAPIIDEDGSMYVPVSFFTKVLNTIVKVDADGNVDITPAK